MATRKQHEMARRLLQLKAQIDGRDLVVDMYQSLQVQEDLDVEMEDGVLGYLVSGALVARAERIAEDHKIEMEEMRGALDEYAREMEVLNRPTDQKVKAWVDREPSFVAKKKEVARAKEVASVLKFFNRAYEMKVELIPTRAGREKRQQQAEDRRPGSRPRSGKTE